MSAPRVASLSIGPAEAGAESPYFVGGAYQLGRLAGRTPLGFLADLIEEMASDLRPQIELPRQAHVGEIMAIKAAAKQAGI